MPHSPMSSLTPENASPLPPATEAVLASFVRSASEALREDLLSIVLFGSGAEGRLRPSSDLNLLLVLARFDQARVDAFREPLRLARIAQKAAVGFVLAAELPLFAEAFAVKFDDIQRRHRILFGADLLASLSPSREARIQRLRQVLLNLTLRLRERYASLSLRDEQLVSVVIDLAGPLRSAAATLLDLEGTPAADGREALRQVAARERPGSEGLLEQVTHARRTDSLPPGQAGPLVLQLLGLVSALQARSSKLK